MLSIRTSRAARGLRPAGFALAATFAAAAALPAAATEAVNVSAPVGGPEQVFMDRFAGAWTGEGEVLRNEDGKTRKVACRVQNTRSEVTAITDGECRAMVIFRRDIGSEITFAGDGTATGVYRGADVGPAELVGRLNGDVLELEMTYENPVYGDRKALMKITNPDNGTYSVAVYDQVDNEGDLERVSIVTFTRAE